MLASIQFDGEFGFRATEVGDVISNCMLPAKSDTKLVIADT